MQRRRGTSVWQKRKCRQCQHYIHRSMSPQTSVTALCLELGRRIPSRRIRLCALNIGSLCLLWTWGERRREEEPQGSASTRSKLLDILILKCQLLNYQSLFLNFFNPFFFFFFFSSRVLCISPCNSVQTFYQQIPGGKSGGEFAI